MKEDEAIISMERYKEFCEWEKYKKENTVYIREYSFFSSLKWGRGSPRQYNKKDALTEMININAQLIDMVKKLSDIIKRLLKRNLWQRIVNAKCADKELQGILKGIKNVSRN